MGLAIFDSCGCSLCVFHEIAQTLKKDLGMYFEHAARMAS